MALRALARAWHNDKQTIPDDNGRGGDVYSRTYQVLNASGILVPDQTVLTHPGFSATEGQGIYTYPFNPHIRRNFIYAPKRGVDTLIQRTLGTNILVQKAQKDEDVIIQEIWLGGGREVSTLAEMARTFHQFHLEALAPGETLGWEPRDVTGQRFKVKIVDVILGSPGEFEYNEIQEIAGQSDPSYLNQQLTLLLKPESPVIGPSSTLTVTGT